MKSYQGEHSIHMVGRAWQIRIMLKQWQNQWGPEATIVDIITTKRLNKHANTRHN